MTGRVLSEALTIAGPKIESVAPHHQEASWQNWHQYLDSVSVNGVTYYDEGNGEIKN